MEKYKPYINKLIPFFDKHPNVILDGELYNHEIKNDFEKIISLVRKTKPTDGDRLESAEMVQFHCYDIINEDWLFKNRNNFIQEHFGEFAPSCRHSAGLSKSATVC